jgi:hypothetical protein
MPVQNIWWWFARPWVSGETQTWSMDVMIPPQTVYAFAAMQYFDHGAGGFMPATEGAAFGGISFYWTGSQEAPVPHNVGAGQRNGVLPGIFDENVWRVEFTWGLSALGINSTSADFTFQIFGWG